MSEQDSVSKIWPSLDSIQLKCPRPLAGSGGYHWWYNDCEEIEEMERQFESDANADYVPIVCKSCGLKLKLSVDAPEYPGI